MGLQTVIDYIVHRFKAQTRHGVHSPFVFELIDQCIYQPQPKTSRNVASFYRQHRSSNQLVKGFDYGMGKETNRTIGDYAKSSSMPAFQSDLMARLIAYLQPKNVLELGSNIGKSLAVMASVDPDMVCTGVEGNEALSAIANENIKQIGIQNAHVLQSTFDAFFETNTETYDFIFLDGDHHYEPTLRYFHQIKECLSTNGCILLHDIYWSEGMKRAWAEIKKDRSVTLTVDLFFFGIVWCDPSRVEEHFKVRYPKGLLH